MKMKKKMRMKKVCILLLICVSMMITACGGGAGDQTQTQAQTQAAAATTTTAAAATEAAANAADETTAAADNNAANDAAAAETTTQAPATTAAESATTEAPYEFTLYGNIAAELLNGDKKFFEELSAQTNTKINVQLPPSSNYDESLTIMMAGGDYPELVLFPDHTNVVFMDGVRDGAVLALNEYINNAPNIKQYSYDLSFQTLSVLGDGVIYGIPRTSIARADGYVIRKDWLDNLNIPFEEGKPITLDEFRDILVAFTNNDPDGNGINDTYGLGQSTGDGNLYISAPIAWAYGLIGWQEYPNEDFKYMNLQYSKKSDNFKQALAYVADLLSNRLIDPDWPTVNTDTQNQRYSQGITGVRPEFVGWMPNMLNDLHENAPDAELAYIVAIVQNDGDIGQGGSFSTGFWGQWCVMNTAKNPQKIVDVIDYMLSDEFWPIVNYGLEGVAWEYDNANNRIAIPDSGYNGGRAIVRRNNAPEFFVGLNTAVEDRERIVNLINICIEQSIFSMDAGFRPATADDPAFIDANREYNVTISKIIAGDLPLDAYDGALESWYAAGGQKWIEEMNEGIEAAN